MATTPGYQKREDGNVYYVIGGNTMRVHEVLYKKGSELRLDAADGTLNLKGRKICINGTDITEIVNIAATPDASFATTKDIAKAISDHTTNSKNAVHANVDKVPTVPTLKQLSASLNNFLGILGNNKTVPANGVTFEHLDKINATDWSEDELVTAVNNLIDILNAFFGS